MKSLAATLLLLATVAVGQQVYLGCGSGPNDTACPESFCVDAAGRNCVGIEPPNLCKRSGNGFICKSSADPSPKKMLIAPMGLQDGDICIVHDNLCTKIEGGTGITTFSRMPAVQTFSQIAIPTCVRDSTGRDWCSTTKYCGDPSLAKDEHYYFKPAVDPCAPTKGTVFGCMDNNGEPIHHATCTDKRRIKLQSEDGAWHCLLFPKEPN